MLNDSQFVNQSLNNGLFYLRCIRDYCIDIQLSFYKNNESYSQRASSLARRCEEIGRDFVINTQGYISSDSVEYQLFVTNYTLPCEKLTEELFDITLATDITESVLNLQVSDEFIEPSLELVNNIQQINQQANELATEFILFATEIKEKLETNRLFSYTYPSLYSYMIGNVQIYQNTLKRLQRKLISDPVYAANMEFLTNSTMYAIALFVRGLINTAATRYLNELNYFISAYPTLIRDYQTLPLTPDNQKSLTKRSLAIIERFRILFQEMLQDLIDAKLYFISEALMIDSFYTDINFFYYQLNENEKAQEYF